MMSNLRYDLKETATKGQGDASELEFIYTPPARAEKDTSLNARLKYVTAARYEGDWHSNIHSHAFSELFLVTGGVGQVLVDGRWYDVKENDFIIINPQVEHTEVSRKEAPLEYIVLGIEGLQFVSRSDPYDRRVAVPFIQNEGELSGRIRRYMELLLEEVQQERYENGVICQNILNIILFLIHSCQMTDVSITAATNITAECAAVRNYIDAHFKEPITLDVLAHATHRNKYYVAHAFKSAFGISPIKYLMERRVKESKYLLADTDYSVGDISALLGFSSASHFSQAFRRSTGETPNEYRKAIRR